ncbi:MAG: rod shape-determining protein MreC [Cyanobacteria bacterium P01_F01_bin.42]
MHNFSRWWSRNRSAVAVSGVAVVTVGILKAFDLLPVRELYQFFSQPFQAKSDEIAAQVNASTSQLQSRIQILEQKNQVLEKLLGQPQTKRDEVVTALVIGRAVNQWWQHVFLNQGTRSRLQVDDVVESAGALVGRVVQVTPHSSQVLLVSDPDSRLAVLLSRSRSVGILQGDRTDHGVLDFFEQDADVKVGDQVITSPLSCLFPADIPVGTVKSIDRTNQASLKAQVEFSTPLNRLEWVRVYSHDKIKKDASASTSACP